MVALKTRGRAEGVRDTILGPVSWGSVSPGGVQLVRAGSPAPRPVSGVAATLAEEGVDTALITGPRVLGLRSVDHLDEGDIVAVHPSGIVETLFRVRSTNNALFVTDRCNSNCLMCSQPPRDVDDVDRLDAVNRRLVPLVPKETEVLGITGGEPTLLGGRLIRLIGLLRDELPETAVHMLTNGRAFTTIQCPPYRRDPFLSS